MAPVPAGRALGVVRQHPGPWERLHQPGWITARRADTRHLLQIDKLVQHKPADLQEGCNTGTASPGFINQFPVRDPATSSEVLYPFNSFPRGVAGAAVAADEVKCQTKPLSAADCAAPCAAVQWARLQAAFPAGVCDWPHRAKKGRLEGRSSAGFRRGGRPRAARS